MIQRASIHELRFSAMSFGFDPSQRILSEVDFSFPQNQVAKIDSPAGAGKSTLLKLLCGLCHPCSGDFLINGQSVNQMSFAEFVPYRLNLGYAFDLGGLLNNRTLRENVELPMLYHGLYPTQDIQARVDLWFERFGLTSVQHERPSAVSGGRRKVACLIRALIHEPEVLLLDEPTVGLAENLVEELTSEVRRRRDQGSLKYIFVVSSDERLQQGNFFETRICIQGGGLK